MENNGLYETPLITGPFGQTDKGNDANPGNHKSHSPDATDNRIQRAKDERELFFRQHPGLTDRDYLLHVFHTYRDLKGGVVKEVFGGHNPVNELPNWLSPDAAGIVLKSNQADPHRKYRSRTPCFFRDLRIGAVSPSPQTRPTSFRDRDGSKDGGR